jgi:hypothetical protein
MPSSPEQVPAGVGNLAGAGAQFPHARDLRLPGDPLSRVLDVSKL